MLAFPGLCDAVGRLRPARPAAVAASSAIPVVLLSATRRSSRAEAAEWDEMHEDLAGWVPGTELRRIEDSGHDMLLDRPEVVAAAIEQVAAATVLSHP
jgi:pimeloyl-ACP methyl ester carboxylesterase